MNRAKQERKRGSKWNPMDDEIFASPGSVANFRAALLREIGWACLTPKLSGQLVGRGIRFSKVTVKPPLGQNIRRLQFCLRR